MLQLAFGAVTSDHIWQIKMLSFSCFNPTLAFHYKIKHMSNPIPTRSVLTGSHGKWDQWAVAALCLHSRKI